MPSAMTEFFSVRSVPVREKPMSAIAIEAQHKLEEMGGSGTLKEIVPRIRERLSRVRPKYWRQFQAPGRIKRFLYGEQIPNSQELDDIRAAHARFCPEKIQKNRTENAALIESIITFARNAERTDPGFHRDQLQALGQALLQLGVDPAALGSSHRPDNNSGD